MKNRLFLILLAVGMLATGCKSKEVVEMPEIEAAGETETEIVIENVIEESGLQTLSFTDLDNLEFYFASGAGGWRTVMRIEADGSFSGEYSDSDLGSIGEGYPNGTYYFCEFWGEFGDPVKVNDYTYAMKIEEIHCVNEPDTEEIINETLYYYSTPYGLDGAEEVLLYLPGAPMTDLPEEYRNWIRNDMQDPNALELPFYGLYNEAEQNGFSSYSISSRIDEMLAATEEWADTVKASLEHDDLNQYEMNMKSEELYDIWDEALNTLWKELKEKLPEDEFKKLLDEQRIWIAEKEASVKEAGKQYEGGSIYPLVVNMEAAEITKERVYELYELLKLTNI